MVVCIMSADEKEVHFNCVMDSLDRMKMVLNKMMYVNLNC